MQCVCLGMHACTDAALMHTDAWNVTEERATKSFFRLLKKLRLSFSCCCCCCCVRTGSRSLFWEMEPLWVCSPSLVRQERSFQLVVRAAGWQWRECFGRRSSEQQVPTLCGCLCLHSSRWLRKEWAWFPRIRSPREPQQFGPILPPYLAAGKFSPICLLLSGSQAVSDIDAPSQSRLGSSGS